MREQESRGKASGHERQSWPCSGRAGPLWSAATTSGWTSSGGSTKRGRERTCAGRTGDGSGCCGDGARLRQHSYRSQASVACETRELERRALAPHSPVPDQPCLSLSHSYTHTLTLHTAHSTLATSPQLSLSLIQRSPFALTDRALFCRVTVICNDAPRAPQLEPANSAADQHAAGKQAGRQALPS